MFGSLKEGVDTARWTKTWPRRYLNAQTVPVSTG
jgi:hypothetical protein